MIFYIFAQNFNFIVRYKTYRYETLGFYTTNNSNNDGDMVVPIDSNSILLI